MEKLTREERSALGREAAKKRWKRIDSKKDTKEAGKATSRDDLPVAKYSGLLRVAGTEIPAYVLSTGERVIARISATEMLTGVKRRAI